MYLMHLLPPFVSTHHQNVAFLVLLIVLVQSISVSPFDDPKSSSDQSSSDGGRRRPLQPSSITKAKSVRTRSGPLLLLEPPVVEINDKNDPETEEDVIRPMPPARTRSSPQFLGRPVEMNDKNNSEWKHLLSFNNSRSPSFEAGPVRIFVFKFRQKIFKNFGFELRETSGILGFELRLRVVRRASPIPGAKGRVSERARNPNSQSFKILSAVGNVLEAFHELTEQNAPIEAPEGETKSECAVCLGNFEAGDKVRPLPPCEHIFHTECIELWLKNHNNCPLCRAEIFKISSGKVKPNVKEAPNAEARSNTENAAENNV
uniref:RING-type domain-containing protein n=1 Tax=Globodera pallida TaxID=36090 RepID=A0A183C4R0_GLOPA